MKVKGKDLKDYVGDRYGRLEVKYVFTEEVSGKAKPFASCLCECGNKKDVWVYHLTSGHTKSCGCAKKDAMRSKDTYHGLSKTRIYDIWVLFKRRCYNKNDKSFKSYGERGIYVSDEWINNPVGFIEWAYKNGYQEGLEIDRIDNDGPYAPWNCRWVTRSENMKNTSVNRLLTYNGKTQCMKDWSEELGIDYHLLCSRIIVYKWDAQRALTTPPRITNRGGLFEYNGETLTLIEWSKKTGLPLPLLVDRVNRSGWSIEKALTTPVKKRVGR